jgi:pilus assembly protein FimV
LFLFRKNYFRELTVTQQSGNQFDDDLTVGLDDDGGFSTDSIDLFEFSGGDESPIARLKTIILSIDWEINDEILQQLDDELVDLADIWADDKIKLVYIQGLSKIGKYIDKEKAAAHPNSIKLLITFYHNLEKIVSDENGMSGAEQKALLAADVKKFNQLKSQIGTPSISTDSQKDESEATDGFTEIDSGSGQESELKILKAQVLGLDWEISDPELEKLGAEVKRLESVYSDSNGKLILLQGIGSLSSYIKKMKSQSNSKAFSLLHSFYDVLEKTPSGHLAPGEEKQRLLSEVEKFKSFKAEIAKVQTEPEPVVNVVGSAPDVEREQSKEVLPEEDEDSEQVASDVEARLASVFGDIDDDIDDLSTEKNIALEGVNVETDADDDSDEEALPFAGGTVAPALAEAEEESSFSVEKLAGDLAKSIETDEQAKAESISEDIIPGVDVESDADDDSDEDALPIVDGEIAPALSGSFDEIGFDEESQNYTVDNSDADDLDNRLGSFFDDEVESSSKAWGSEQEEESDFVDDGQIAALSDVSDDFDEAITEDEENKGIDTDLLDVGALAPALSDTEEALPLDVPIDEAVEEKLSFFDDDVEVDIPEIDGSVKDSDAPQLSFLDDDMSGSDDFEEILEDEVDSEEGDEVSSFFNDGAPVAALSDADNESSPFEEEAIDDAVEEKLSFFDEEDSPAPALSTDIEDEDVNVETPIKETAEATVAKEDTVEEVTGEEESDEEVFLEEDSPTKEEKEEEVEFEEVLSVEEDMEEVAFEEEVPAEEDIQEEELSFLAEDPDSVDGEDEVVGNEESVTPDEIEVTVPGEIATAGVVAAAGAAFLSDKKESNEDVIEFQVPGEDDSDEIALDISEEAEETEEELVIFEAVGDDVEVDPLPGEEYADNTVNSDEYETLDFSAADEVDPQADALAGNTFKLIPVDYSSLSNTIQHLKGNITKTNLQALFTETNVTRTRSTSNTTGKIFLQLLSTISQHIERNMDGSHSGSLALMDDVYTGLHMSSSVDFSVEQIQQQLLTCISQVLLLQQQDVVKAAASSIKDEKVVGIVQNELTDIKELFLDEIKTLRKEIIDK